MAFDFILNRDKHVRRIDEHVIQRFVLALVFYAMGVKDINEDGSGWDASKANFLTELHECQWVKMMEYEKSFLVSIG